MTDNEIIKALEWWVTVVNNVGNVTIGKDDVLAVYDLINRQKAENEAQCKAVKYYQAKAIEIKAEAIKEFAERIDTHFKGSGIHWLYEASLKQRIDNLVKEMVGDTE